MKACHIQALKSVLFLALFASWPAGASDLEEFKIKREEVFEFARPPQVLRSGDRVEISFDSKGYCDVTVAVEEPGGRILRHLASGVLGPKAPEPFQKNSLSQRLVWDGKDDRGKYLDDQDRLAVRVSLGLNPRFERTLLWEPKRRLFNGHGTVGGSSFYGLPTPLIRAAPEGVYVFDGAGVDHLWLYDHAGNYLRTVYPFPAGKVEQVQGLRWQAAPQDGKRLPLKTGHVLGTLLTSGASSEMHNYNQGMFGTAATALAVRNGRLALAFRRLNRIASDGSSGGLPLEGPPVTFPVVLSGMNRAAQDYPAAPTSAALSPDGKWIYLAGYLTRDGKSGQTLAKEGLHGVARMAYEGPGAVEVFAGSMKSDGAGADNRHFTDPLSVDCDGQGRVYVADFMNDRIQIFSSEGKFLKTLPVHKPAQVRIHQRTSEIYVFSWAISNDRTLGAASTKKEILIPPTLTHLGPFEKPQVLATYPLARQLSENLSKYSMWETWGGLEVQVELDSWTDPPTLWLVPGMPGWDRACIRILEEKGGKLELKRDFSEDIKKTMLRAKPPMLGRQRLYVDAQHGSLYVEDGRGHEKSFKELLALDPETGITRLVPLPFDAEDMAFDLQGQAYLRTDRLVARYEAETWREIPFDYGEEHAAVGYSATPGEGWSGGKKAPVISGLPIYAGPYKWHAGGMCVSPKGHLAVSCYSSKGGLAPTLQKRTDEKEGHASTGKVFAAQVYPGKIRVNEIHVWDKHGQRIYEDFTPGLGWSHGLGLDKDDSLYVLARPTRILDGKPYFNFKSCTLVKFRPLKGKVLSSNGRTDVPLPAAAWPKRAFDFFDTVQGQAWAEGADWMYGGVGFDGKAIPLADGGCDCWNSRFVLDTFARSFAPEVDHFSVAVLDANGNLILRVGRYGNEDDGTPLLPAGGSPAARALGGDEVGLFNACYVATHTDRRLFIADAGNERILSVKLGYHAESRVPLRSVANAQPGP